MPERLQQSCPVITRTAGFNPDHGRGKLLEKCHHLLAPKLLAQNQLLGGIHPVKLENVLRRVHPNSANLFHGRFPLSEISTTSFWHARCRRGPSTPTDEMAFSQLRAPISIVRSNSYAGSSSRILTDPTGEKRNRQFRQRFRGFRSCRPNSSGESGPKKS